MIKINHKLDFLIALYIFCILVAELMGAKTFPLANIFGYQLNASVAIFVIPIIFTINDIIIEVYGKERAHNLIKTSFFIIALLVLVAVLFTMLPPSTRFAEANDAYVSIFSKSIRISLASLAAFAIAGFLDVYVFTHVRAWLGKHPLWLRNNLSNFVAQFVDTTVFMFIAFYSLQEGFGENFGFLVGLIIPYWLLKCAMSVIETPFTYLGVKWLRKDEK
jgi:hypothetical protein